MDMTQMGKRSRGAGIFAGAGALSLLLGATALLVAPSANADQTTKGHGHNPPGNNGTIKIEDAVLTDKPPNNNPHQGCTFRVEFYNYDKGDDYRATVKFEDKSPTADAGLEVVSGNLNPLIGGDAAGGGTDLDASEVYTLKFTGQPHPKQGYHVKITIHADGSIGNDTKHKVFWVKGCDATPPTSPTPPPTSDTPPPTTDTPPPTTDTPPPTTDTPPPTTDTPPPTTDTPPPTSDTPPATSDTPPATSDTPPATSDTPSETAPTDSPSRPVSDVPSGTPTQGVPTEVDAGFGGPDSGTGAGGNSPFGLVGGLLLAAGGVMLAGGGFVALRRRGKHSV
jgi:hypothetical protein